MLKHLTYDGMFSNDMRDGVGTVIFETGEKFTCTWSEGKMTGPGEFLFAEGSEWNNSAF